jgi:hypothetical protein
MSLYMLRSECATEQGLLEGFASEQDIIEDFGNINVKEASYGTNCGVPPGYLTNVLRGATAGKLTYSYSGRFNNLGGDPRVGCAKNFNMTYDCSDGINRNISFGASDGEQYAMNIICPPDAPAAAAPAPVGAIVVLSQHCGGGGWTKNLLSPGTYISGTHFDWDVSQIRVPAGVTAVVTGKTTPVHNVAGTGKVVTVVGPGELNLCSAAPGGGFNGFNDNIATITLSATAAAPAAPCPSCPPCTVCPPCPTCPDMSKYILRSDCRPPCPPPAPPQLPLTDRMATPTAPNTLNLPHYCKSLADNSGFMDMFARA